jgi:hypothetical protein
VGAALAGVATVPDIAEASQQDEKGWSTWLEKLIRAATRSRNPNLKKGWAPDMKELGVAYLTIRFSRGDESFDYTLRPLGSKAGVSVASHRLLTNGSKQMVLLQGDLAGGATYHYACNDGVWPRPRPPIVMPFHDPPLAEIRVQ